MNWRKTITCDRKLATHAQNVGRSDRGPCITAVWVSPDLSLTCDLMWFGELNKGQRRLEGLCSRNNIVARFHPSFMRDDLHWGAVETTCTGNWCLWPDLSRKQFPAAAVFIQTWQTKYYLASAPDAGDASYIFFNCKLTKSLNIQNFLFCNVDNTNVGGLWWTFLFWPSTAGVGKVSFRCYLCTFVFDYYMLSISNKSCLIN